METKMFRNICTAIILLLLLGSANSSTKSRVAVINFKHNGVVESDANALTDRLRSEIDEIGNYTLIEREVMEEIFSEHRLQLSGCVANECILEMGRLLGVEFIIIGSISRIGTTYSIASRIVNVETSEIENTANYDHSGNIDNLLKVGMRNIAYELSGQKVPVITELKQSPFFRSKNEKNSHIKRPLYPYSIGIETFTLPYAHSGDSYSIWVGKNNIRCKYSHSEIKMPEIYNSYGYEKEYNTISMISIDLILDENNLDGYWIGLGALTMNGSIGHIYEEERGDYESLQIILNSGFIKKVIHNIYVNGWAGISVHVLGDNHTIVGDHYATRRNLNLFASVELGWHL